MSIGELRIEKLPNGSYEGILQLFSGRLVIAGSSPDDVEWKMKELGAIE